MRKYTVKLLLIICIFITATQLVFAEDEHVLLVYNDRLITTDKDATFIEGEVSSACGQTIVVRRGLHIVAEKILPDTGSSTEFKIQIPADYISDNKACVLYVQERKDGNTLSRSVRVEIEYKERQKQTITAKSSKFKLTYPGYDQTIDATASSGERLIFSSSDPDVVEVDEAGNLIAKGGGDAEISIKQIGNSEYEEASETVSVSVEEINAYKITFHSSDDEDVTATQIIEKDKTVNLQSCEFKNESHEFLGWATEDGGLRVYHDNDEVVNLADSGESTDLYAVWTGDGASAAIAWAIDIAADDSFAYGEKPVANAIGCYFCGTNCGPVKYNKPKGYEKTYVCLTFVAAAYAHGAEDPEVYYACSHGKMPLYENDKNFSQFSCWTKVGTCKNLSVDDLQPGDVIINWSAHSDNSGHTCMYIGGNDLVESSGGGWGANSIAVKTNVVSSRLKSYGKNSKSYVMRYTGANAQS